MFTEEQEDAIRDKLQDGECPNCHCAWKPNENGKCSGCYWIVETDIHGELVNTNDHNELWESDPNCVHDIQPQPRGGVKCTKCRGWFCY